MKPSSGESAPQASMSRSETSREVSVSRSRLSTPAGRSPVRSTSTLPCGSIRCAVATAVTSARTGQAEACPAVLPEVLPEVEIRRSHPYRSRSEPETLECVDDDPRRFLRLLRLGVDHDLRIRRRLVRVVDPGEARDLAGQRLRVEPVHVAACTLVYGGLHVHLDEAAVVLHELARLPAGLLVRRDRGG